MKESASTLVASKIPELSMIGRGMRLVLPHSSSVAAYVATPETSSPRLNK